MAQTYKTEGIILKRWDYKERDRMVKVLTRDYGKLTARAISARKITSKLAGHLEPFIHTDLHIARSKTIDIVAGSNTIAAHKQLRYSLPHNAAALYFSEVLDSVTHTNHVDPDIFHHAQLFFEWLNTHNANILVLYAAIVQLFEIAGHHFGLYECHVCYKTVEQEGSKFHFGLRNVECADCSTPDSTIPISATTIKVLRESLEQPFDYIEKIRVDDAQWNDVVNSMRAILQYQFERPLYAEPLLTQFFPATE